MNLLRALPVQRVSQGTLARLAWLACYAPFVIPHVAQEDWIGVVPLTDALRVVEDGLNRAPVSEGVPIASIDTIVIMKLLAGRTQDLADVEAIVASGTHRDRLMAAVQTAAPDRADALSRLFGNVDRER